MPTLPAGTHIPIKRLLIACPASVKAEFKAPDDLFEAAAGGNYLKLFINRENYRPIKSYRSGGGNQYTRSFITPRIQLKAAICEIEVTVVDERAILQDMVKRIAQLSISTDLQTQTPIKVIDYVLPEKEDRASAIAASTPTAAVEPYTTRTGLIKEVTALGGSVSNQWGDAWGKGFTFKFEEVKLRLG